MNINLNDEAFDLKKHFENDEKIIWLGKPGTGIVFNMFDMYMVPFSILWGGFALFWEFIAITSGAPIMFALFGLPFVIAGIYLIFGRFYFDIRRRKNTIYALTNKRIFFYIGAKTKTISTLNLNSITDVIYKEKSNGKGSLIFSYDRNNASSFRAPVTQLFSFSTAPSFELIDNAADVYKKVNTLLNYY